MERTRPDPGNPSCAAQISKLHAFRTVSTQPSIPHVHTHQSCKEPPNVPPLCRPVVPRRLDDLRSVNPNPHCRTHDVRIQRYSRMSSGSARLSACAPSRSRTPRGCMTRAMSLYSIGLGTSRSGRRLLRARGLRAGARRGAGLLGSRRQRTRGCVVRSESLKTGRCESTLSCI